MPSYYPIGPASPFVSLPIDAGSAIVWEGDSITNAFGVTAPTAYPALVYADPIFAAHSPGGSTVKAVDGTTIAILTARYAAQVFPLRPAANGGRKTFLSVFIGTNDYQTAAAGNFTALEAYWTQAKADGFTVIAWTIPISFRPGTTPQLNQLILKSIVPDLLIDAAQLWFNETDATVFQDQLHPTTRGHAMLARMVVDQLTYRNRLPHSMPPNGFQRCSGFLCSTPAEVGNTDFTLKATTGFASAMTMLSGTHNWIFSYTDSVEQLNFLNYNGATFATPMDIVRTAGNLGILRATGVLKSTPVTVANLIAGATAGSGAREIVTDANSIVFNSIVAGGGANTVPVYWDGANWRIG